MLIAFAILLVDGTGLRSILRRFPETAGEAVSPLSVNWREPVTSRQALLLSAAAAVVAWSVMLSILLPDLTHRTALRGGSVDRLRLSPRAPRAVSLGTGQRGSQTSTGRLSCSSIRPRTAWPAFHLRRSCPSSWCSRRSDPGVGARAAGTRRDAPATAGLPDRLDHDHDLERRPGYEPESFRPTDPDRLPLQRGRRAPHSGLHRRPQAPLSCSPAR